jgi:hypothetical protein
MHVREAATEIGAQPCTTSGTQTLTTASASSAAATATAKSLGNLQWRSEILQETMMQLQFFQQPGQQRQLLFTALLAGT